MKKIGEYIMIRDVRKYGEDSGDQFDTYVSNYSSKRR